jgi:hypothetical protein
LDYNLKNTMNIRNRIKKLEKKKMKIKTPKKRKKRTKPKMHCLEP